ncbi:MAG: transporter substrate-binding domain-containing protein [Erysipelotrichales bacterium]
MKKLFSMKKIVGALVLVMLVLTGCSSKDEVSSDKLEQIKKNGKIVVGTNSGYPPYEFYDTSDGKKELTGYDVKLGNQIAKDLGVEIEWKDMDFDALTSSLQTDKIDIVLAGMVATPAREKNIDFSTPYFDSETKMFAKSGNINKYKDLKNLKDKTIVVQAGTTQEEAAKAVEGAKVLTLPLVSDTMAAMETGKADVLFIAEVSAKTLEKQYKGYAHTDIALDKKLLIDGASVGIKKDQAKLKAELDKLIKKYQDDKSLDKWFNESVALSEKVNK